MGEEFHEGEEFRVGPAVLPAEGIDMCPSISVLSPGPAQATSREATETPVTMSAETPTQSRGRLRALGGRFVGQLPASLQGPSPAKSQPCWEGLPLRHECWSPAHLISGAPGDGIPIPAPA